jgi:hypothetical protein
MDRCSAGGVSGIIFYASHMGTPIGNPTVNFVRIARAIVRGQKCAGRPALGSGNTTCGV